MTEQTNIYDVLDLKALRCFWAMAKNASLTGAGIELGISESAVSQRVKSLETYLEVKLYESPGGRVRLTTEGDRLMERALSLFEHVEDIQTELTGQSAGQVNLAADDPTIRYLLPGIVQRYTRDYPQVRLRIRSRPAIEAVELVRRGDADLGIVSQSAVPKSMAFYPWQTFEAYLLMPLGHPLLRRGRPTIQNLLNPATIMENPLILPEPDDPANIRVAQALEQLGLPVNAAFEVGTIDTVKHYVSLGLGLAVLPGVCITEGDKSRFAAIQIPKEFGGTATYGALLRKDKYLSNPLRRFLEMLKIRVRPTSSDD